MNHHFLKFSEDEICQQVRGGFKHNFLIKKSKTKMSKEMKRNLLFYGIGLPTIFVLMSYSPPICFTFILGVCIGSIIEKSGWNYPIN